MGNVVLRIALPVVLFVVLLVMLAPPARAEIKIEKVGDTVVDAKALVLGDPKFGPRKYGPVINGVTGQQEAILTYNGYQYATYYDADRHVCLARRERPAGEWQVIRFTDYLFKNNDGHNFISMGICPGDGTIHLAFDHHTSLLHYRVSKKGVADRPKETKWDASLFGPVRDELANKRIGGLTYPRFVATPEGKLQMFYRGGASGGGNMWMHTYDPTTATWSNPVQLDSGAGVYKDPNDKNRCSYPNGYTYGPKGRMHVTWVWRETSRANTNHDLMYAYSEDRGKTWRNDLDQTVPSPLRVDTPGITALKIPMDSGLANQCCQAVDSQGRIHTILRHYADVVPEGFTAPDDPAHPNANSKTKPSAYFHYWRKGPGQWVMSRLPGGGGARPKLFFGKDDTAYMIAQKARRFEVFAATAESEWNDWQRVYSEEGPFFTEPLADPALWESEGILSVLVQEGQGSDHKPTALRVLDLKTR
ncbi:MAG: hypothetical protein GC164_10370 [Phycisphaera sp.]|nr:hypothetical protein [Phycisphaera sp.]